LKEAKKRSLISESSYICLRHAAVSPPLVTKFTFSLPARTVRTLKQL